MSENQVLILMIVACLVIFGVYLFIKQRKALSIFAIRAIVGGLAIYVLNTALNLAIGLNPVTVIMIGVLGLPGMLVLLLVS